MGTPFPHYSPIQSCAGTAWPHGFHSVLHISVAGWRWSWVKWIFFHLAPACCMGFLDLCPLFSWWKSEWPSVRLPSPGRGLGYSVGCSANPTLLQGPIYSSFCLPLPSNTPLCLPQSLRQSPDGFEWNGGNASLPNGVAYFLGTTNFLARCSAGWSKCLLCSGPVKLQFSVQPRRLIS